mgnify:CR=1 FL=1
MLVLCALEFDTILLRLKITVNKNGINLIDHEINSLDTIYQRIVWDSVVFKYYDYNLGNGTFKTEEIRNLDLIKNNSENESSKWKIFNNDITSHKLRKFQGKWYLFYTCGTKWITDKSGKPEIIYKIKVATSSDLVNWKRDGDTLIQARLGEDEAQACPDVFQINGTFHMFYCYRRSLDFRKNIDATYRIGHAISKDLHHWEITSFADDFVPSFDGFDNENCLKPIGWLQQRDMSNLPFAQSLDANNWFNNIVVNLPVNTMLLMLIMIWMFTGFAAVVFSAGIKAIPQEIMEAGQIDGASEIRVFRSIVIPYIKSTIIVVGTYMVVTVLKAFDIIYVSTRGDLETNLLAVKMLDEFSKYRNFGRSATVAVLIFVCVLPIIIGTAIREKENAQS